MLGARPFTLVASPDQWRRCSHRNTRLDPIGGAIELAFADDAPTPAVDASPAAGATAAAGAVGQEVGAPAPASGPAPGELDGLVFVSLAQGFHARFRAGIVERFAWPPPHRSRSEPLGGTVDGDFHPVDGPRGTWEGPGDLAVDRLGQLYVHERSAARVSVVDADGGRVLRRIPLAGCRDLLTVGGEVWALVAAAPRPRLERLGPEAGVRRFELQIPAQAEVRRAAAHRSRRLAVLCELDGASLVADIRPDGSTRVVTGPLHDASDLELTEDGVVVRTGAGGGLRRFVADPSGHRPWSEATPLYVPGDDGRSMTRAPGDRIAYWSPEGPRTALVARRRYLSCGEVTTYRLDSGAFQTRWGRLFLDACVPEGTSLWVGAATSDDDGTEGPSLERTPPVEINGRPDDGRAGAGADVVARGDRVELALPPTLPLALVHRLGDQLRPVHRRSNGPEVAWTTAEPDSATYEAAVAAPPGRYLWLRIGLRGTSNRSPRILRLRVEKSSHDLLRRLPRVYSADAATADFLQRFFAAPEGLLAELAARSDQRHLLLDARAAPSEALDWLASFLGLVLDRRWPGEVRRQLIDRTMRLFRHRGTVLGLREFLGPIVGPGAGSLNGGEHGSDGPQVGFHIVERYSQRLPPAHVGSARLGTGLRLPAANAEPGAGPGSGVAADLPVGPDGQRARVTGTQSAVYAAYAHRFTLVVHGELSDAQRQMVGYVLDHHRPAHTLYDICSLSEALRLGLGSRLGVTTFVGRNPTPTTAVLGAAELGFATFLGAPQPSVQLDRDLLPANGGG